MSLLDAYKQKLTYMRDVTEIGLDDLEKIDVGMRALKKYHDRASDMSDEYRANFVELFGQDALDKVDAVTHEIGVFLSRMGEILNG